MSELLAQIETRYEECKRDLAEAEAKEDWSLMDYLEGANDVYGFIVDLLKGTN